MLAFMIIQKYLHLQKKRSAFDFAHVEKFRESSVGSLRRFSFSSLTYTWILFRILEQVNFILLHQNHRKNFNVYKQLMDICSHTNAQKRGV